MDVLLHRYQGHQAAAQAVTWSPDGRRLASGSGDTEGGEVCVWDVEHGGQLSRLGKHPGSVFALAWGAGEEILITGSSDGRLRWWDVQRWECLFVCDAHRGDRSVAAAKPRWDEAGKLWR